MGNWGGEGPEGWGWEGSCLCQGGPALRCTGMPNPHWAEQGETGPSAAVPPALAPSPGTPGAAVGQPTAAAGQGRQDTGRGLLPAAPGPSDAAAKPGKGPSAGHAASPDPAAPIALPGAGHSRDPAAPCMYSYLHMYRVLSEWEPPCPSGRLAILEGWGQGATILCQPLTKTLGQGETSPPPPTTPFLASLSKVWGWVGWGRVGDRPLGFLHLRQAGKGQICPIAQSGVQPFPADPPAPAPSCRGWTGA